MNDLLEESVEHLAQSVVRLSQYVVSAPADLQQSLMDTNIMLIRAHDFLDEVLGELRDSEEL